MKKLKFFTALPANNKHNNYMYIMYSIIEGVISSQINYQDKTRQDNFIHIWLHRVQYGENINKIDSQSVFCSGSWHSIQ